MLWFDILISRFCIDHIVLFCFDKASDAGQESDSNNEDPTTVEIGDQENKSSNEVIEEVGDQESNSNEDAEIEVGGGSRPSTSTPTMDTELSVRTIVGWMVVSSVLLKQDY